ncbi:uncharacterized protein EI97DRAFT_433858 [Westerdykella ornata]|uniref:MARVEL domain-containing protein n=1 Tax=Westerdykella ornata TaxID=318751 RepID=A0A6A6JHN1_WESOR|nr:uncharacterized protein EI97DRAFT_433858 [Westerdykella ornata]KAF2275922.1 hypothetical protein EI97DRAFT_433858 [Westerdykella ornata]
MTSPVINFVLRGAQLLFAIVVLGLSVDLVRGHNYGSLPVTLGFAAFVGGVSVVGALLGLAATWVEALNSIIGAGIDIIVALINLAGGVLIAIKLKGADCSGTSDRNRFELNKISIINGGCEKEKCWYATLGELGKLNERCRQNTADSAFMFLLVITLLASATVTFLHARK